jgi:hypothetical protein
LDKSIGQEKKNWMQRVYKHYYLVNSWAIVNKQDIVFHWEALRLEPRSFFENHVDMLSLAGPLQNYSPP